MSTNSASKTRCNLFLTRDWSQIDARSQRSVFALLWASLWGRRGETEPNHTKCPTNVCVSPPPTTSPRIPMSASWHPNARPIRLRPLRGSRSPLVGCVFFQVSSLLLPSSLPSFLRSPPVTVFSGFPCIRAGFKRSRTRGVFFFFFSLLAAAVQGAEKERATIKKKPHNRPQVAWLHCLNAIGYLVMQTKPSQGCRVGVRDGACSAHRMDARLQSLAHFGLEPLCTKRMCPSCTVK